MQFSLRNILLIWMDAHLSFMNDILRIAKRGYIPSTGKWRQDAKHEIPF